jgi:hypothetical protein
MIEKHKFATKLLAAGNAFDIANEFLCLCGSGFSLPELV